MPAAHEQVFLSRQAIFDKRRKVVGYELMMGAPHAQLGHTMTMSEESAAVITDAVLAFGLDTLTDGRPTFMKVSKSVLLAGLPSALPAKQVVIELPNDIDSSAEVRAACTDLRRKGYRIALDHFAPTDEALPLVPFADFIKSDVGNLEAVTHRPAAPTVRPLSLVATRVETPEDFATAAALGCASFQGDFVGRPVLKATRDIPPNRLVYVRLFHALQNPDLSPRELEDLIKPDASLVYRVLRAVNSASFAQHQRVDSLRQALVLLGTNTVRRWSSLWTMASFSVGAPDELVAMSTVRGRTCELIANADTSGAFGEGFLLGMCSLLDAILEIPMTTILKTLPLPEEADTALRGEQNRSRALLDCVVAYEHGHWEESQALAVAAGIDPYAVPTAYGEALRWHWQFRKVSG